MALYRRRHLSLWFSEPDFTSPLSSVSELWVQCLALTYSLAWNSVTYKYRRWKSFSS